LFEKNCNFIACVVVALSRACDIVQQYRTATYHHSASTEKGMTLLLLPQQQQRQNNKKKEKATDKYQQMYIPLEGIATPTDSI